MRFEQFVNAAKGAGVDLDELFGLTNIGDLQGIELRRFLRRCQKGEIIVYDEIIWPDLPDCPEGFKYDRKSDIGVNRLFYSPEIYIVDTWEGKPFKSDDYICGVFINVKTGNVILHTHYEGDPDEEWIVEQLLGC